MNDYDERRKRAMRSAVHNLGMMLSLPGTENTPRELQIKKKYDLSNKCRFGQEYEQNKIRLEAEWEYLKTMCDDDSLEKLIDGDTDDDDDEDDEDDEYDDPMFVKL